jgi:hypothetical protein
MKNKFKNTYHIVSLFKCTKMIIKLKKYITTVLELITVYICNNVSIRRKGNRSAG